MIAILKENKMTAEKRKNKFKEKIKTFLNYIFILDNIITWFFSLLFAIFIYTFDKKYVNHFILNTFIDQYIDIIIGLTAIIVTLFGILAPIIITLYYDVIIKNKLSTDPTNFLNSVLQGAYESAIMLISFFLSIMLIKSSLPGIIYSNDILGVLILFFIIAICKIIFSILRTILKLTILLIQSLRKANTLK